MVNGQFLLLPAESYERRELQMPGSGIHSRLKQTMKIAEADKPSRFICLLVINRVD